MFLVFCVISNLCYILADLKMYIFIYLDLL
uniref:Uncharacterized protein n=1 Tax=Arundo donax TaxID=35708 RepID=A0A0A8YS32_ARUDO